MIKRVISFIDMLFILVLVLLVLPDRPEEAKAHNVDTPGAIHVAASWPDACDTDVDVWVRDPDGSISSYLTDERSGGAVLNLLRDDRGELFDRTDANYEDVYSRGAPLGEYVVNAKLYRHSGGCDLPIPVEIAAEYVAGVQERPRLLASTRVVLERPKQEVTAFIITMGANGRLIAVNRDAYQPLSRQ